MGSNATTLSIEDRILASCEGGSLQAEYALFKPRDRRASELPPGEAAMVTSAAEGRARLEGAGVSLALAEEAAAAIKPDVIDAYALADAVRSVAPRLGAYELFEGKTFDPASQLYDGAWIDLRALANDLNVPGAGLALQALHLAAAMAECEGDARVILAIEQDAQPRRADRAFHRVPQDYVRRLMAALRALRPTQRRARVVDGEETRRELSRLVRDRSLGKPTEPARRRLEVLEQALAAMDVPARGPLASIELWAIERQLADNDPRGVEEKLVAIERTRGKTPATRYLREHAAFVRGTDPPRRIAERLSHWMRPGAPFYELDLLKARAWLAAGMPGYARHYARGLVEDRAAPDSVCLVALEILDVTSARSRTVAPPPVVTSGASAPASVRSAPIVVLGPRGSSPPREEIIERASSPPQDDALENEPQTTRDEWTRPEQPSWIPAEDAPSQRRPSVSPPLPREEPRASRESAPPPPVDEVRAPRVALPSREDLLARTAPFPRGMPQLPRVTAALVPGASRPPFVTDQAPSTERMAEVIIPAAAKLPSEGMALRKATDREPRLARDHRDARDVPEGRAPRAYVTDVPPESAPPAPPRRPERYIPEDAETLPLPPGLSESMLAGGVVPGTPDEVRIACTRMSRELARDYRLWYGSRIQTSAIAIEAMQRHLLSRWPDGKLEGDDAVWEMRRHGALLSEILARALGGYWVDVKPTEVGYWAMFVPPSTRTWPFGRIVRFVSMGHREKDLVSYYLGLVARTRKAK